MTTPLLLLRAVQLGVQIGEMDLLTIGTINDMYTEMQNYMMMQLKIYMLIHILD